MSFLFTIEQSMPPQSESCFAHSSPHVPYSFLLFCSCWSCCLLPSLDGTSPSFLPTHSLISNSISVFTTELSCAPDYTNLFFLNHRILPLSCIFYYAIISHLILSIPPYGWWVLCISDFLFIFVFLWMPCIRSTPFHLTVTDQ